MVRKLRRNAPGGVLGCGVEECRGRQRVGFRVRQRVGRQRRWRHLNWGHASALQSKRILVDAEGANQRLLDRADAVVHQCQVRHAFEEAPHHPVAGTSSVSAFTGKI